jgi:hypothetical protein
VNFREGQLISIGAANQTFVLSRLKAATVSGSDTVDITGSDDSSGRGMYVGQYLVIGTAFPTPTKVLTVTAPNTSTTRITLDGTAATTLTDAQVKEQGSLLARVVTKTVGASTELATEMINGSGDDLTGVDIRDASAGIDCLFQVFLNHVYARGFEGPGVAILTNGTGNENANNWQINGLQTYNCRNAVVSRGQNSQNGTATSVISVQSREWAVIEDTQAGSTWIGTHADAGLGTLVRDSCAATILGHYIEGGTFSSYSDRTTSIGGAGPDFGGYAWADGTMNRVSVGNLSVHTHHWDTQPDSTYFSYYTPDGDSVLELRRVRIAAGDVQGGAYDRMIGFVRGGGGRRTPFLITLDSPPSGMPKFAAYMPQGFYMGCSSSGTPDFGNTGIHFFAVDDEPAASYWDYITGTTESKVGDVYFISGRGSETCLALRCKTAGVPGSGAEYQRLGEPIDEATVQTTDNTTTTAATYAIPVNTAVRFDVRVTAQQDDGSDMAWFDLRISAFRDGSAAPTTHRAAAVVDSEPNITGTAWTAVLDISSNDVRVRVTGDTGKNVNWNVRRIVNDRVTP